MISGFPADGSFAVPSDLDSFSNEDFASAMDEFLSASKRIFGAQVPTTLTISNGSITPVMAFHLVQGETPSTPDELTYINPALCHDGMCLTLVKASSSKKITVRPTNGVGGILTADGEDVVLSRNFDCIRVVLRNNVWYEFVARASVPVFSPKGRVVITSSQDWTVPDTVSQVFITGAGGGGGGAGGGGESLTTLNTSTTGGALGSNGGSSTFKTFTATGGARGANVGYSFLSGDGATDDLSGKKAVAYPGYTNGFLPGAGGVCVRNLEGYGAGGRGGSGGYTLIGNNVYAGGGGAAGSPGQFRYKVPIDVTPGEVVSVVVGAGGSGGNGGAGVGGGANGGNGVAGSSGVIIVEY